MRRNTQTKLLRSLRGNVNAAEGNGGVASVMPVQTANSTFALVQGKTTPPFKAQFKTSLVTQYYTENGGGVYASILPAALNANLQVATPFFLFATMDFDAGYKQAQANNPLNGGWIYGEPFVFGRDPARSAFGSLDANVTAQLQKGDVVVPLSATVAAQNYVALKIVRSQNVAYASLLSAANSNTFELNLLRYTVTLGQEDQFNNTVFLTELSMFGKYTSDNLEPTSFIAPEQDQSNIADIDIRINVDKNKGITTVSDFDVVNITWNMFVKSAMQIK